MYICEIVRENTLAVAQSSHCNDYAGGWMAVVQFPAETGIFIFATAYRPAQRPAQLGGSFSGYKAAKA